MTVSFISLDCLCPFPPIPVIRGRLQVGGCLGLSQDCSQPRFSNCKAGFWLALIGQQFGNCRRRRNPQAVSDRRYLNDLSHRYEQLCREQETLADSYQKQLDQERLLLDITLSVRQSLNLNQVMETAVTEVRSLLRVNRVLVYQFQPDWRVKWLQNRFRILSIQYWKSN